MANLGLSVSKRDLKAITESYQKYLTEEERLEYTRSCKSAEERLGNREESETPTTKDEENLALTDGREYIEGLLNNFDETPLQGKYALFFQMVKENYLKLSLTDLRQVGMLLEGVIKPFSKDT